MKKSVTVSVPGKVHLMGEHAVVYGKPALLSAINLRMRVSVRENGQTDAPVEILTTEPSDHVRYAVGLLFKTLNITEPGHIKITIDSDIPAGFHLGSSAAVAVGLAGAVLYFYKKIWNPIRMNELAYEIEKKQHGNPSGGDNTAVSMGGFIWFRKELEFLRSIWQLPFRPHASLSHFFLINTGKPNESTGEMVALVKKRIELYPDAMRKLLDLNELQTKLLTTALKTGDEDGLIGSLRTGEQTLEAMGVVSKTVVPLLRSIEAVGGAVKILGGGGRSNGVGFLLCYHHDPGAVEKLCAPLGYTIQQVELGEEGARLDEK